VILITIALQVQNILPLPHEEPGLPFCHLLDLIVGTDEISFGFPMFLGPNFWLPIPPIRNDEYVGTSLVWFSHFDSIRSQILACNLQFTFLEDFFDLRPLSCCKHAKFFVNAERVPQMVFCLNLVIESSTNATQLQKGPGVPGRIGRYRHHKPFEISSGVDKPVFRTR
jgi:hypothetical protein